MHLCKYEQQCRAPLTCGCGVLRVNWVDNSRNVVSANRLMFLKQTWANRNI